MKAIMQFLVVLIIGYGVPRALISLYTSCNLQGTGTGDLHQATPPEETEKVDSAPDITDEPLCGYQEPAIGNLFTGNRGVAACWCQNSLGSFLFLHRHRIGGRPCLYTPLPRAPIWKAALTAAARQAE